VHTLTGPSLTGLAVAVALAGCSSSDSTTTPQISTTTRPSASTALPPREPSSRPGDRKLTGLLAGAGVNCVVFQADGGDRYALTGAGVTPEVRRIANSGRSRQSLGAQPTDTVQVVHVTVFGSPRPDLTSPCGLAVLVTTSVVIGQPA
jgi:hypothetical protein